MSDCSARMRSESPRIASAESRKSASVRQMPN